MLTLPDAFHEVVCPFTVNVPLVTVRLPILLIPVVAAVLVMVAPCPSLSSILPKLTVPVAVVAIGWAGNTSGKENFA